MTIQKVSHCCRIGNSGPAPSSWGCSPGCQRVISCFWNSEGRATTEQEPDPGVDSEALQGRQREVSHWPSDMRDSLQLVPPQPAGLPSGSQVCWKGGWKIALIDYPLKKVYGADQYVVENSGLPGQRRHKTGLCQSGSKGKKSLEKNVKPDHALCSSKKPILILLSQLLLSESFSFLAFLFFPSSLPVLLCGFHFFQEGLWT